MKDWAILTGVCLAGALGAMFATKKLGTQTKGGGFFWGGGLLVGEPREGEYHLENCDLLLKLTDEEGLQVIVQVYVDSAPEWVVDTKYPEGRYAAQDGLGKMRGQKHRKKSRTTPAGMTGNFS